MFEIGLAILVHWVINQSNKKKGKREHKGAKAPSFIRIHMWEGGGKGSPTPACNPNPRRERKREGGPTDGELGVGDGVGAPAS